MRLATHRQVAQRHGAQHQRQPQREPGGAEGEPPSAVAKAPDHPRQITTAKINAFSRTRASRPSATPAPSEGRHRRLDCQSADEGQQQTEQHHGQRRLLDQRVEEDGGCINRQQQTGDGPRAASSNQREPACANSTQDNAPSTHCVRRAAAALSPNNV